MPDPEKLPVDLYDSHYARPEDDLYRAVRAETYGEDLGQASWLTASECDELCRWAGLRAGQRVLEVARASRSCRRSWRWCTGWPASGGCPGSRTWPRSVRRAAEGPRHPPMVVAVQSAAYNTRYGQGRSLELLRRVRGAIER